MFQRLVRLGGYISFHHAPDFRMGGVNLFYEKDGSGGGGGADDDNDDDDDDVGNDDSDDDKGDADAEVQKKIDAAVAKEKRGWQKRVKGLQADIGTLEDKEKTTKQEKKELATKRDELEAELNNAEEREQTALRKKEKEHKEALQNANTRADVNWKRYVTKEKEVAIASAATVNGALNLDQIRDHVLPRSELVEDKDKDGEGLGTYSVRVEIEVEKEGGTKEKKSITVEEYVAHLRTLDSHKNLFGSARSSGTGHRPGTSGVRMAGEDKRTAKEKIGDGLKAGKAG